LPIHNVKKRDQVIPPARLDRIAKQTTDNLIMIRANIAEHHAVHANKKGPAEAGPHEV
jgi:hypothetical protein